MEYFFARPRLPHETHSIDKYADGKRLPFYVEDEETLKNVINHNCSSRYKKIPTLKDKHVTMCLTEDSLCPNTNIGYEGNWELGKTLLVTHVIKIGSVYVLCDGETNRNARLSAVRLSTEEEIKSYNDYIKNELYVR